MVLGGGIRVGLAAVALAFACSCGSPSPARTPSVAVTASPAPRPSAATGACSAVTTTTPIDQVSAACAALWAPYGVTKVPPANLTDTTPTTPQVVNATNGAVSDAQLSEWIAASNRDSLWYRWAEANDEIGLLPRLGVESLDPAVELKAMAAHEPITQPDCALFPTKVRVFAITPTDQQFFAGEGESVSSSYAFVGSYPGPCAVTAQTASGQTQTLASYPSSSVTFYAGHVTNDALLGEILYYDGAGNCADRGAPTAWCQS
jgi:hypothetical protein